MLDKPPCAEIPRHRKKSGRKPAKKANHRHVYTPCVFSYGLPSFDTAHGIVENGKRAQSIGSFCPVCGKIGTLVNPLYRQSVSAGGLFVSGGWSSAAHREFDPATRTLPAFSLQDMFQKYVDPKDMNNALFAQETQQDKEVSQHENE